MVIERPRTPPYRLLFVALGISVSWIILFTNDGPNLGTNDIPSLFEAGSATTIVGVIFCMPLRHPELPRDDIGHASHPPDAQVRSPEDNLTLWQFMTVSWMSPLISVGSKRQLNDEDVWSLAWEFQHRRLHDTFRELKGSVVTRLLKANWIDLVLMCFLSIWDQIIGKSQRRDI